jgi:hypothetical protein
MMFPTYEGIWDFARYRMVEGDDIVVYWRLVSGPSNRSWQLRSLYTLKEKLSCVVGPKFQNMAHSDHKILDTFY